MELFARFGNICNLKNVKIIHGEVLHLVKLQTLACNITKSNIPPLGVLHIFKIIQIVPNRAMHRTK